MSETIENHGIIGDMRTCALVALDGSIDYLCWPSFDSPSVFAALLDDAAGGRFAIAPHLPGARRKQLYFPDTNVLLTRFLSSAGVAEISDFMALDRSGSQRIVRRVKAIRQAVRISVTCAPRFDYARQGHDVRIEDEGAVFESTEGDHRVLRLRSSQRLSVEDGAATCTFELQPGESASFILEDPRHCDAASADPDWVPAAFKQTCDFWRAWIARSTYRGPWREAVNRSALTLKLLTSRAHGSIVAAATFGLPEQEGGSRNWDYRYTWLRDAAFTVYAFLRLGFTEEADAFMRWLSERSKDAVLTNPYPVMFAIDGSAVPQEERLDHLSGYHGSKPVRIGNNAAGQLQLDVYGELMDAAYLADKYGQQLGWRTWQSIAASLDWLRDNWQQPDDGIWEPRGDRRHNLHSRLMSWVALDRGIRMAHKRGLPADLVGWRGARDAIRVDINENFWDANRQSFVQHRDSTALDASTLLMPLVRFVSPTEDRWLSTMEAIGRDLTDDSLVYRYSAEAAPDRLAGQEGTFSMCSFWYVECVARSGDLPQARFLFEKMLSYANPLGLYAEEIGPDGAQLGNFPQAFTHLALISAAYCLDRAMNEDRQG